MGRGRVGGEDEWGGGEWEVRVSGEGERMGGTGREVDEECW